MAKGYKVSHVRVAVPLLATLPATDKGIQAIVSIKARMIAARQRDAVPVDTGELRESIGVRSDGKGGRLIGSFDCEYAVFVEFGHRTTTGRWVKAQPFLRPSVMDGI